MAYAAFIALSTALAALFTWLSGVTPERAPFAAALAMAFSVLIAGGVDDLLGYS